MASNGRAFLGLDLGTRTGYAYRIGKGPVFSGTWNHSPRKGAGEGARFLSLWERLDHLSAQVGGFYAMGFEQVQFIAKDDKGAPMISAGQVWAGYHAIAMAWAEKQGVHYLGVHTGTLKKFGAGNGKAKKEDMIKMFRLRLGREPGDDNEADAFHVLEWIEHETRSGRSV